MSLPAENPFATASQLAYGLPPFDRIREEHYQPAFAEGMAEQRRELTAITTQSEPPTVANTLEALERSGALLHRVSKVFFNLLGSDVTDGLRAIEDAVVPQLAAHQDAIGMDPGLFSRVNALVDGEKIEDGEERRLLERYHRDLVRAGAGLAEAGQARLREINQELSVLSTTFRNRLQADTNELAVHVADEASLAGLPAEGIASAAAAARARQLDGYLLKLSNFTAQPALAALSDRGLRERIYRASISRGSRGNEHDTRAALVRIVELRAERAALLGYPDHAAYIVADQTAGSGEAVMSLLTALVQPAVSNAEAEAAVLTARLKADGFDGELQPWDWAYYAEREARQRFDRDTTALRGWFELGRVLTDGVFAAAGALYGLTFVPRPDLPTYHPDVQVFEVFADFSESDSGIGLFVADWYARDSKRGGAWMTTYVDQSRLLGEKPVVAINLNIARPPAGVPTLLTLAELKTTFHEFGHVLHGLLSDVRHRRLSGTSVPRDFVEFPSQVNEMWALRPELLSRYAVHHETGEPLSQSALDGVLAARSFGQGYATTEVLAAMLLDQAWHQLPPGAASIAADDVARFEQEALAQAGIALATVPPRYGSSYFSHIFALGYSAGYYSYLWSEVLAADTEEWFVQQGGLNRESGDRFRRELLSRGGAVDPMAAYAAVLGRPPRVEPLLERRGLTPAD
jgi:peptidyl-dipeptidase Dcp